MAPFPNRLAEGHRRHHKMADGSSTGRLVRIKRNWNAQAAECSLAWNSSQEQNRR